jgi:hypothetical protein
MAAWRRANTTASASGTHRVRGELRNVAGSGHGPWHLARSKALSVGLSGIVPLNVEIGGATLLALSR